MRDLTFILKAVRYVAIFVNDELITSERPEIENTSSSESNKYEKLIINPTLQLKEKI